ncbi:MAG: TIGR02301 family protein [Hyphomicrobiaceae bacterium]
MMRSSFPSTKIVASILIGFTISIGMPVATPTHANAQNLSKDVKPYDDRILRLSEILGAVHYLRALCGSNDEQLWRKKMQDLTRAEGSSALRRARLTRRFNQGYRSYQRTYNVCTPSAKTTINRFLVEGVQISEQLFKSYPK